MSVMASTIDSTSALLNSLTDALTTAATAFPSDEEHLLPPVDGISLLDVKNDLLLSYLHNLVFLIILRLRSGQSEPRADPKTNEEIVRKLVELRAYMERGVRPLEGKLRYQIDKVLRAADDADRLSQQNKIGREQKKKKKQKQRRKETNGENISDMSTAESDSGNSSSISDDEDDEEMQERIHRPNTAALASKGRETQKENSKSRNSATGVYKPPRITATAMPLPPSARDQDSDRLARRRKSNLVNEYIDEEMSSAPKAQPSIGSNSTILDRGRGGLSTRDREKQRERLEYEERNFVRLPGESKTEKRKARLRGQNDRRDVFGGEDWTGLGGMGDRIGKSVAGKGGASVLARREKRKNFTEDGPRGDGTAGIGDAFDRRKKVLDDRAERKRRKKG